MVGINLAENDRSISSGLAEAFEAQGDIPRRENEANLRFWIRVHTSAGSTEKG